MDNAVNRVELGAQVKVPQGYDVKEIKVLALAVQRRGAEQAQLLYQESEESTAQRQLNAQNRKTGALSSPKPDHRPDKKQRRKIIQLKQQ
jgi:ribosome-associated heat shock protein Hsp15